MLSTAPALGQALFDALDGDAALATELGGSGRIHAGRAPTKSPFPHITYGNQSSTRWNTHDKRSKYVSLSAEGKKLLSEGFSLYEELEASLFAQTEPKKKKRIVEDLNYLNKIIKEAV